MDISTPSSPTLTGRSNYSTYLHEAIDVAVSGNYAYITQPTHGLYIVDISTSSFPKLTGKYDTAGVAVRVDVSGNYAYVADNWNGLVIVDVTNSSTPTLAGSYCLNTAGTASNLAVLGNYVYVSDLYNGIVILRTDIQDQDWNPWNDPGSVGEESITLSELQEAIYDWRFGVTLPNGEKVDLTRLQGLIYSWRFG